MLWRAGAEASEACSGTAGVKTRCGGGVGAGGAPSGRLSRIADRLRLRGCAKRTLELTRLSSGRPDRANSRRDRLVQLGRQSHGIKRGSAGHDLPHGIPYRTGSVKHGIPDFYSCRVDCIGRYDVLVLI